MKQIKIHQIFIFLFLFCYNISYSQWGSQTGCGFSNTTGTGFNQIENCGSITPSTSRQIVNKTTSSSSGTEHKLYYTFTATAGRTYVFDLGAMNVSYGLTDNFIYIFNGPPASGTLMKAGEQEDCDVNGYLEWTCTTSGTYYVLLTYYCGNFSTGETLKLGYYYVDKTTCNGTNYFDPGGSGGSGTSRSTAGNYFRAFDGTQWPRTYTPPTGYNYKVVFSSFATESGNDKLYIYNGNSTAAPQFPGSPFSGSSVPGGGAGLTSTAADGSITFVFVTNGDGLSDDLIVGAGWDATITSIATASVIPSISGNTVSCTVPTATLSISNPIGGATYSWTGPSTGSGTSLSPASVGAYTVTADYGGGCTSYSTYTVISNTTPPNLSINNSPIITCSNPTINISGSTSTGGVTYAWTGPAIETPAGSTPTASSTAVSASGTYTLKITNTSNGCFNTGTVSVTSNTTIPTASAGSSQTITCTNTLVTLTGTTNASSPSYSWTPSGNSPTTAVNTTSVAGTYTLKVTNTSNGCFNTGTVSVTSSTTIPTASAGSNQTITCTNTLVTLTGTTNASSPSYSWTPSGNSPTTAVNTTSVAGTYTLKVTNTSNGCFNTGTVSVTSNTTIPTASAGSNQTITCTNTLVTLTGTTNASSPSYSWTPSGNSPTTAVNSTSVVGTYTLKVIETINGCSNTSTMTVTQIADSYITLNKQLDAQNYSLFCNKIYFKIDGEYDQTTLSYKIYKYDHTVLTGLSINSSIYKHGDNRYSINLSSVSSDNYILEVTNQFNEKRYLKFTK